MSSVFFSLIMVLFVPSLDRGGKIYNVPVIDGSLLSLYVSNYGMLGHRPSGGAGGWWPRERTNETYIYGAGLWVGALKRNAQNPDLWDTVVTWFYNPSSGDSEGCPAYVPTWIRRETIINEPDPTDYAGAADSAQARVYLSNSDNEGYGWPIKDLNGVSNYFVSNLDSYTRYSDFNPARQEPGSTPLGIVVDQWSYQFEDPVYVQDIVFLIFRIWNYSGDTLKNVYLGPMYDFDIGNEAGMSANDLVRFVKKFNFGEGLIPLDLGYQYQLVPEYGWVGVDGNGKPGVIGSVLLSTPLATDTFILIDTIGDHFGPDTILPGEPLGMTAFKIVTLQTDPQNDVARYKFMAGWDIAALGGRYNPFMDDVYGPGDKRFIQVTGPFNFRPGEYVELAVAIIVARDTNSIKYVARDAISFYRSGFTSLSEYSKKSGVLNKVLYYTGELKIQLNSKPNGPVSILIFDPQGRIVFESHHMPSENIRITESRLSQLPRGIYFVNVKSGEQKLQNLIMFKN